MDARVLIIGGGIAGSTAALGLADRGIQVVLVRPSSFSGDAASFHAQGGIVYQGVNDSPRSLSEDIRNAGACCGNSKMINLIARRGPEVVEKLLLNRLKIPFDRNPDGGLSLTREAAHSCSRIIHSRDATGRVIMEGLEAAVIGHAGITCLDGYTAIELLSSDKDCLGAVFINPSEEIETVNASVTVLATGGAGSLFQRTSNPSGALGHGPAMAGRVGAIIKDMEYVQFHPTALALPGVESFLISEAVRGAGARLVTPDNIPFMEKYSPDWKDLAPRDVVTRAIYKEMSREGLPNVCLNLFDYIPQKDIIDRFPTITDRCLQYGIDITRELLPVAPAAHFVCGGIAVDDQAATSLPGLYAVGECSCTGIHGANRLASTSLLEGILWADRAAERISVKIHSFPIKTASLPSGPCSKILCDNQELSPKIDRMDARVKNIMWEKVGIVRTPNLLREAVAELNKLGDEAERLYSQSRPTVKTASLRNMISASVLIVEAAFRNRLSRGCHFVVS